MVNVSMVMMLNSYTEQEKQLLEEEQGAQIPRHVVIHAKPVPILMHPMQTK